MVGVRIEGRLGNQLFQYAFAKFLEKELNTNSYIDKGIEKYLLPKYFNVKADYLEDKIFSIEGYKNLFNIHARRLYYQILRKIFGLNTLVFSNDIKPETQLLTIKDHTLYHGFFQSEKYFLKYKELILKDFEILDKHKISFDKVFQKLPKDKNIVTVHIRRGDYVDLGINLPMSYYHKCIEEIDTHNTFYVFISDDPVFVESEFSYISNKFISKNSEIIDFQLLTNANYCILSNSTFSWWGAYLNNKNATIYGPEKWSVEKNKSETPIDIIPNKWKKQHHV